MLDAFGRGGLDTEKIGPRSYAVRAGLEYHLPFPGFVGEEMGVTFDRDVALRHPERAFLSWDHPMVRDVLDGHAALGNIDLGYKYHWWDGACLPLGLGLSLVLNGIFFAKPLNEMRLLTLPDLFARKFGQADS